MGYSRKEEIARIKSERREAKAAKKREEGTRELKVRFLIVCEGEKTEPYYFEALVDANSSAVREVSIEGQGMATMALVDQAQQIRKELELKNKTRFDRVWIVFDKDSFQDFNQAIAKAKRLGMKTAWTNEAFELWYYLHFEYLDAAIGRHEYLSRLRNFIGKCIGDKNFWYQKGSKENYRLITTYGNEEIAKRHAKRLRRMYNDTNYAAHNPCTQVDLLVEELEHPETLNKKRNN